MDTIRGRLAALVAALSRAEADGDAQRLEGVLSPDFTGVGPAGFVLRRNQWMQRFANGLVNDSFELAELDWRIHEGVAVGIGIQRQRTSYQGHRNDGEFRVSLIAVPARGAEKASAGGSDDGAWLLLGVHLSPIMARPPQA
ncbi:MAG: nuclear transport factor 2 family protein [Actinomycetota bacterium]|nr:nuclear transport factor 2 family protein [Actinomycetota bacterium]